MGHRRAIGRRLHYMQYFDWDRYDAEGDEAEAAVQGGAAGGEQGGEARRVSVSIAVCGAWC